MTCNCTPTKTIHGETWTCPHGRTWNLFTTTFPDGSIVRLMANKIAATR